MDRATEQELDHIYDTLEEGDTEHALEEAEELARRFPQDSDALLALAAARFEADLPREAVQSVEAARDAGVRDETLALGIEGSSRYELGELERARECFERLLELEPERAEAWYDLSCTAEHLGDSEAAARSEQKAAELDPENFFLAPRRTPEQFDEILQQAIETLPEELQEQLEQVPVVVQPLPPRQMLGETGISPDTLGLFVGENNQERSVLNSPTTPQALMLFQRNIERMSVDDEELVEQIHVTLYHELGHLLGWEEEDLEEHGLA
jgi:predicted Zn-dependent protease with MMP-like domain